MWKRASCKPYSSIRLTFSGPSLSQSYELPPGTKFRKSRSNAILLVETIDYVLKYFRDTVQFGKQIARSQLGSDISLPLKVGINSASRMLTADAE
jgi:hypothetical protein